MGIFKRLLFALLLPLIFILTGLQIILLYIYRLFIWVATGKDTDILDKELLIDKAFKMIENNEDN